MLGCRLCMLGAQKRIGGKFARFRAAQAQGRNRLHPASLTSNLSSSAVGGLRPVSSRAVALAYKCFDGRFTWWCFTVTLDF